MKIYDSAVKKPMYWLLHCLLMLQTSFLFHEEKIWFKFSLLEAAWLDIEADILFVCFFFFIDLVCWLHLLCCWELDSVPVSQCVLVFGKNCFQLFQIFYFFIVYRNPFRCLEQRRFFMKCFSFADGNIFRFQMEPLNGDISGKIPPMKPSEC